jgi:hypothetical protein
MALMHFGTAIAILVYINVGDPGLEHSQIYAYGSVINELT